MRKIKVEVPTRKFPNTYEVKNYYGTSVKTLVIGDVIAHKLVAILDRKEIANRDLFDAHYFLNSKYSADINYNIIKYRTNKNPHNSILSGLGEVLDVKQKLWVKQNLLKELRDSIRFNRDLIDKLS